MLEAAASRERFRTLEIEAKENAPGADADADASSVNGALLTDAEKKQRRALIDQVKQKSFDQVSMAFRYR